MQNSANTSRRFHKIEFSDNLIAQELFGPQQHNIKIVEDQLRVQVHVRGAGVSIAGPLESAELAANLLEQLYDLAKGGFVLHASDVDHASRLVINDPSVRIRDYFLDTLVVSHRKKRIVPRSPNQKAYVDSIRCFDIVFGIGPAGTGKTYLAMAMAVAALLRKEVSRIVLTRPAVEAGEKLGFLPGDLAEKVNPYLRPLYDALHDMMEFDKVGRLMEKGVIEVAPLAFMRGRTLNDSFVIFDEAQNSTSEQMKMFLTRLGIGSKAVITGDITQIDLPQNRSSGLIEAREILANIDQLRFILFTKWDVVRHRLVQKVVEAYEHWDRQNAAPGSGQSVRAKRRDRPESRPVEAVDDAAPRSG